MQTLPLHVLRAVKQEQIGGAVVKMENDRIQSPESPTMMDDRKNASNEPITIPTERKGSKNYSYDGSGGNHRRSYEERSDYHRSGSSSSRSHRHHRDRRSRTPERRNDYGSRQNSGSRDRDHYSRDHKHERDSRVSLDRDRDRNRDRDYDSYRARSSHKTEKFDDSKRSVDRSSSRGRYQNPFAVSDRSDRYPSAEPSNNKSVFGRLGAKIHERNDETAADPLNDDVINELDDANDQRFGRVDDNKALLENYQKYKTILQLSKDLRKEEMQKAHNDMLNELVAMQAAGASPDDDATAPLSPDMSVEMSGDDVPPHQETSSPAIVPPAQERVALKYNPKPRKRFDSNESSSPIAVQNTPSSTYTPTAAAETQFDSIRLRTNNRDPRSVSNGPVPLPNNGNPFAKQNNCNATPAPSHHAAHAPPPHHQQHAPPHHQTHVPSHHPPHVPVHLPPGPHMPHMPHAAMHPMHGPMHLPMLSSNGLPMRNHPPHPPNFFVPPNRQPASNHFNEAPMFAAPNESNQFGMHSPPVGPPFPADGQFYPNMAPRRQTYADHKRQLELEKRRESANYRMECVSSTTNLAASAPTDIALNSNESILVTTTTQPTMSPTAASTPTAPAAPTTTQNPPPKSAPKRIEHTRKEEVAKSPAPPPTPPPKSILDNAFRANNWGALSSSDHHSKKAQFKIPKLNRSDSSHSKSAKKTSDKKSDENSSTTVKSTAHKSKSSKHSSASHQNGKIKPSMRRRKSSSARETAVPTSSSSASSSPLPVTEIDDTSETTTADSVATPAPTPAEKTPLTKEDLGQAIEDLLANLLTPSGDPLPSNVQSIIGAERIQQLKERLLGLNKTAATNGDDSAVSSSTAPVAEKSTEALQPDQNAAAESEPKPVRRPRRMNELEKLQENLDSTFIRNEVLAATGKRSCTLDQNQRSLAAKKPPTPTKPKAKIVPKNANDSDASSGKQK